MRALVLLTGGVAVFLSGCAADVVEPPPTRTAPAKVEPISPRRGVDVPVPGSFQAKFETSKGDFVIEVVPEWAPRGAERFRELIEEGFYDDCRFFRVVKGFMAQIGINGDPKVHAKWGNNNFPDDPVKESNKRGFVSFATAGPNTRSTQFFINFGDNSRLDQTGFSPFGRVISGMDVVDQINNEYGERPSQRDIEVEGNVYLAREFPNLDFIKKASIITKDGSK